MEIANHLVHRAVITQYQADVLLNTDTGPLVLAEYVFLDRIGRGGFGEVYRACQRRLNRFVAVKTLISSLASSQEVCRRFLAEGRSLARLDHPNIVRVHDAREVDGIPILVMEWIDGDDMNRIVKSQGPLPVEIAFDYLVQLARGLEYAHSRGIIHRDVKPANAMVDKNGVVRLMDLGLAKLFLPSEENESTCTLLTVPGNVCGTPGYMSPEQAGNPVLIDARADIYSLGATLYYLLVGQGMYPALPLLATMLAHKENPIPCLADKRSDVPPALDAIYQRMVAKRPEDRFQNMTQVLEALASFGEGKSHAHATHSNGKNVGSVSSPVKWKAWLLVGILLAGAGFAVDPFLSESRDRTGSGSRELGGDRQALSQSNGVDPPGLEAPETPVSTIPPGKSFQNSIGMRFALIPAGEFDMGSQNIPEGLAKQFKLDERFIRDEQPVHHLKISHDFYLGVHEVTIGQFRQFVEAEDFQTEAERSGGGYGWNAADKKLNTKDSKYSWRDPGWPVTDDHPVVNVSWNDAMAFIEWLSQTDENHYRLPTEAEWEYACRANTMGMFSHGPGLDGLSKAGNVADRDAETLFPVWPTLPESDGYIFSAPVGTFLPNAFGIHDLHGNVWEWCGDWYAEDYYSQSDPQDPLGPLAGTSRVLRGGSWAYNPLLTRSSARANYSPDDYFFHYGFRVVCEVKPSENAP